MFNISASFAPLHIGVSHLLCEAVGGQCNRWERTLLGPIGKLSILFTVPLGTQQHDDFFLFVWSPAKHQNAILTSQLYSIPDIQLNQFLKHDLFTSLYDIHNIFCCFLKTDCKELLQCLFFKNLSH